MPARSPFPAIPLEDHTQWGSNICRETVSLGGRQRNLAFRRPPPGPHTRGSPRGACWVGFLGCGGRASAKGHQDWAPGVGRDGLKGLKRTSAGISTSVGECAHLQALAGPSRPLSPDAQVSKVLAGAGGGGVQRERTRELPSSGICMWGVWPGLWLPWFWRVQSFCPCRLPVPQAHTAGQPQSPQQAVHLLE